MIKKILVSQPKPSSEKSPYYDIAERFGVELVFRPFIKPGNDKLAGGRIDYIVDGNAAEDALGKRRYDLVAVLQSCAYKATESAAVLFGDDNVMRHVNKTTREVTGIGCLHGRIGKTLTGTVGGDEVLKH